MKAHLICSGTELLLGQTLNTNAQYLGQELAKLGIDLHEIVTVGDNLHRLSDAIRRGGEKAGLVLVSGGLGPTEDDLTREALAEALQVPLVYHREAEAVVTRFFQGRSLPVPEVNRKQFCAPPGARILDNPFGTAPGIYYEYGDRIYVLLPGPPRELQPMFEHELLPLLKPLSGGQVILSRVVKVAGLGEPAAEAKIKDLLHSANPTVAPTVKRGEVHFRITAKARGIEEAKQLIRPVEAAIYERLGDYIFGKDEETIEEAVAKLLWDQGLTIAVAESCSGGLLAHRLTNVSGSSAYFQLGTVVYHNRWKEELLDVPGDVLAEKGAVSPETAEAMARGIRAIGGTDIGIGITGIAGPLGGTEEKPVGLVYLGLDFRGQVKVWRENWVGSRWDIKWMTSQWALMKLYQALRQGGIPE